ncbi:MAG: hypothetical protein ACYDHE_01410 [Candidatus Acidiferrales bacterium]
MPSKKVGPLLTGDFFRGVTNQKDDVWLIHRSEVHIPNLHDVAVLYVPAR